MRIHDVMRYYHPFPEAIPLSEAGYSRVTHPSATNYQIQQAFTSSPFDLHVLSTPPAFVLSQDQTLPDRLFVSARFCLAFFTQILCGFFFLETRTSAFFSLYCSVFKEPSL